ncbi:DUF3515 domain-containing protein [Actinoalloteichus hymeniacidonis]|uniref:DUF3515 family protein n=1 Tax=Actinoalloteichus hymeniacidonis TaxID=340345 RepID=A0AAC9N0D4_9PSEU|nr:DUF3515 domain-containing protein [Actinoalloteichus hymeniacidonis]AOS65295.1 putative DUF3515 family protein [Actinoalloteichus hymeniacidonis]MBB5906621.1 hypothetical protein [Actinoalloteichus hymeniacidonis]
MTEADPGKAPRPLVVAAIGLPLALAVAVGVLALNAPEESSIDAATPAVDRTGPLPLVEVPAEDAESAECESLTAALPEELSSGDQTLNRRELMDPAPVGAAAWGNAEHDPVVLRCGLGTPAELTSTSALVDVSGVQWLEIRGEGSTTWTAVDRPVSVALTTPDGTGSGALQGASAAIGEALPAVEIEIN